MQGGEKQDPPGDKPEVADQELGKTKPVDEKTQKEAAEERQKQGGYD